MNLTQFDSCSSFWRANSLLAFGVSTPRSAEEVSLAGTGRMEWLPRGRAFFHLQKYRWGSETKIRKWGFKSGTGYIPQLICLMGEF